MAVMRKEQKEIDRLGPVGIAREAFKLSSSYFKFFTMIQVTFLLPLAVFVTLGAEYSLSRIAAQHNGPGEATRADAPLLASNFSASFPAGTPVLQLGLVMVALLLAWAACTIFVAALVSLASAAIIYAVGLHYTGQVISFHDVIRAVVPRLWMRLTITKIYQILLFYGMVTGQLVGSLLLVHLHAALPVTLLGVAALAILSIVGSIYLEIVFLIACVVAVLEKDYGWAALRRTPKLLKGRVTVALLFQLLLLVPALLLLGLQRFWQSQIASGDYSPSSIIVFVIITVLYISCTSFLWQLRAVCAGVQYVSFKAYHNEDLAESIFEKQVMKVGYERIGSGTVDAKLGEQGAESLV